MTATTELFEGTFWNDPYPAYTALREDAPVRKVQTAGWSTVMTDDSPQDETMAGAAELTGYLGELIERKRANPDEALLSALIEVADEGDRLSHEELVSMAMLLIAGHETTVNLIGNGLLALLTHPEQRKLLQQRPELIGSAVEEFLRWDSPVHSALVRFAAEELLHRRSRIIRGLCTLLVELGPGSAGR